MLEWEFGDQAGIEYQGERTCGGPSRQCLVAQGTGSFKVVEQFQFYCPSSIEKMISFTLSRCKLETST
jgi:hypothetical protein